MTSAVHLPPASRQPVELSPRPPFRLDLTVWALRRRKQNAIDTWDGHSDRRALRTVGEPLELVVTQTGLTEVPARWHLGHRRHLGPHAHLPAMSLFRRGKNEPSRQRPEDPDFPSGTSGSSATPNGCA